MSEQPAPSERKKPQTAWLCFQCGADFRSWTDIPFDERMIFLMAHREFQIAQLLEDRRHPSQAGDWVLLQPFPLSKSLERGRDSN
jgi:hypothetical protein